MVLATSGLFLLADAQFLAAGTVIVYAGAIIVMFLFVIMLAQMEGRAPYDRAARAPFRATLTCFVLFWALLYALFSVSAPSGQLKTDNASDLMVPRTRNLAQLAANPGKRNAVRAWSCSSASRPTAQLFDGQVAKPHVAGIGETLYTDYLVTVELAGALLFVALVGALAIATPKPPIRPSDDRCPESACDRRPSHRESEPRRKSFAMAPESFTFELLRNYLMVGSALMILGMIGFLARRNLIVMFLSAEMMLQGTALSLVGFGRYHGNWTGQVFTIVILTVAACEASIALALTLILFNRRSSLDVTLWQDIREPGQPLAVDTVGEAEPLEPVAGPESYPHLTPAGVEPPHPDVALDRAAGLSLPRSHQREASTFRAGPTDRLDRRTMGAATCRVSDPGQQRLAPPIFPTAGGLDRRGRGSLAPPAGSLAGRRRDRTGVRRRARAADRRGARDDDRGL